MADFRNDLERIGRRVEPSGDALEHLETRRRRKERNRRLAAGTLALLIAIGGSIAAYAALRDDGPPGIAVGVSGAAGDELAPDVARVTCDGTTTVVERQVVRMDPQTGEVLATSSAVRPQADGVHLVVSNTSDRDLAFEWETGQWDAGGENADMGEHELVLAVAPGITKIRCHDSGGDAGAPGGYVELQVVDRDGIYVSTELACDDVTGWFFDHVEGATGDPDPVQSAQENLHGLEPGDVVEVAGYPGAETRQVRVIRDGEVVAVLEYSPDGQGGWLESSGSSCVDGLG